MVRVEATLLVASVEETRRRYEEVLGWRGNYDVFDNEGRCLFGMVYTKAAEYERDKGDIGFNIARNELVTPSSKTGFEFLIYVDDVDQLYERIRNHGWGWESSPMNQPWGGRTFNIHDINGFTLTFAQMIENPTLEEIQERIKSAS